MAKQETPTPTPITKAEFEAGVKFFFYEECDPANTDTYNLVSIEIIGNVARYIQDRHKRLYCHIQRVEDDGFTFINYTFRVKAEGKIYFEKCFKSEIQ